MRALLASIALLAGCRETPDAPGAHAAALEVPAKHAPVLYPGSPASLVAGARKAVVGIRAKQDVKSGPAAMFPGAAEPLADKALGTGFLVEAKGVFVLTNDHIAAGSPELLVVLPGQVEVAAKIVGRDPRLDLALLAIDVPNLHGLPFGDSDGVQVGDSLLVLGNPFGEEVTASMGITTATGREGAGSLAAGRQMGYRTYLQTDARVHRGNSGGPVLDTAGQVVGVALALGDRPAELSFAIPINRVKEVIDALRDFGQVARSWLGVKVKPVTKELAQQLAMPVATGALVTEIAGGPAARAGLRPGDVIVKFDNRPVDHTTLPFVVAQAPAGNHNLGVWRTKAEVAIPVVTEKMPE